MRANPAAVGRQGTLAGRISPRLISKMQKDLKNVSTREARKTAFVVSAVLILASLLFWYRGRITVAAAAAIFAAVLLTTGALSPAAAKLFHRGWMTIAF